MRPTKTDMVNALYDRYVDTCGDSTREYKCWNHAGSMDYYGPYIIIEFVSSRLICAVESCKHRNKLYRNLDA